MNAISYSVKIDLNELSRLLTAATVSRTFRNLLLTNPKQALANGYNGEVFHLDAQDLDQIMSIQALSLHEFAQQLIDQQQFCKPDVFPRRDANRVLRFGPRDNFF
jgi:hypothetical protein